MKNLKIGSIVKIIKPFQNKDLTGKTGIVTEISKLNKPIFYIEIEGIKTVCLPDYVEIIQN